MLMKFVPICLLLLTTGLAGCASEPAELVVSNATGAAFQVEIDIRDGTDILRSYNLTVAPGVLTVTSLEGLPATLTFVARSERGLITQTFTIDSAIADIGLFVAPDAYEWTSLMAGT